jgi:DHA1 family bicyclomycin/chloramphenicol resistance-like MFS transporter
MQSVRLLGRNLPLAPLSLIVLGSCLWPEMELLVPSLPAMKDAFQVTDAEIQQLLTSNFIGFLCGVLFAGGLCDSLGRKKLILWGLLFYILASGVAVLADSFSLLMVARFFQGLAVTAPIIGGSTMLMDVTRGPNQITWISLSSASVTMCMAGAPLIGAWINVTFGYQGNLLAIFCLGILGGLPILFLPETLAQDKKRPLEVKILMRGYGEVLRNKKFIILVVPICVFAAAYWVYSGVSALYMVDYLQMDPALFGRYQGPIVGAFSFFSVGFSFFYKRLGIKCIWIGGLSMLISSLSLFILSAVGIENAFFTTIAMMFYVAGMVPANSLLYPVAIKQLPVELQGSGQSLLQGLRLFAASIGTSLLGLFYTGPFMPVAIILLVSFVLGTISMLYASKWLLQSILEDNTGNIVGSGH